MFSERFIRTRIKECIDSGKENFVVIPFGTNGMITKKCLEDCFAIKPLIVDNGYAQYNSEIKNFEYLRHHYKNNMTILLTIEDEQINQELEKEILSIANRNQLVNFYFYWSKEVEEKKKRKEEEKRRSEEKKRKEEEKKRSEEKKQKELENYNRIAYGKFSLDKFLPNFSYNNVPVKSVRGVRDKIRIRFFHCSYQLWNSIKTIVEAFERDEKYDVLIILKNLDVNEKIQQMEKENHSYILVEDYDARKDNPDIFVLSHFGDRTIIKSCRNYAKLIIVATMTLVRQAYSLDGLWDEMRRTYERFHPDYYLFDSLLYEEIRRSIYFSDRIVEMGNAKFDDIYERYQSEKQYPDAWRKLIGKKVILWTTDHGYIREKVSDYITFDLYAKVIFQYALEHPDVGIIMRLHKTFVRNDMLANEFWSEEDIEILREYCCNSSNVVWDETDSYACAYSLADGILTDALCGITLSALTTMKPICVMYRNKDVISYHPELTDCYYSAYSEEELISFFDMINKNEDPMYEIRLAANKKYIKSFDGKNGLRIKNFIEEKYFNMEKNS